MSRWSPVLSSAYQLCGCFFLIGDIEFSCLHQNNAANLAADFSAIKELDSLSNEIVELQR